MELSTFANAYILSFWVLLFIPAFFHLKAQADNRQRLHYDAHFVLVLKNRTLTCFILKATLLFVEQLVKLKFVDESLMNEPNAYICPVTPIQDVSFYLHLKNHTEGWFWSRKRLSLNERIRMIVWILFFYYDYVSVLYLV